MKPADIAKAIDIHSFLDRLEERSCIQNYYRINHLSPQQIETLAQCMAESLAHELKSMGLQIEA